MDEKELKTSPKQRVFIIIIAIFMVGSIVASYIAIVLAGGTASTSSDNSTVSEEKIAQYEEEYNQKTAELSKASEDYFDTFIEYKSEVKAFNETSANENGVQTKDLKEGSGRKLEEGDTDYLAYYIGYCADESIFDSTLDDEKNPTAFTKILDASVGMIEGWNTGITGMKLGGVRRITIPGELAYGDSMEICGGYNKPLRFLVMPVANEDPLKTIATELGEASMRLQYAQYGIDYEEMMQNSEQ